MATRNSKQSRFGKLSTREALGAISVAASPQRWNKFPRHILGTLSGIAGAILAASFWLWASGSWLFLIEAGWKAGGRRVAQTLAHTIRMWSGWVEAEGYTDEMRMEKENSRLRRGSSPTAELSWIF